MKKLLLLLLVVIAASLIINGCGPTSNGETASAPVYGSKVGNRAIDFGYMLGDQAGSLAGLQGKPVMMNFWATWCGPCRQEIPFLQDIYKAYSGKGLVMLAIDIGENKETVQSFLLKYRMTLPVVYDFTEEIARQYRIGAIPTTYFIDKSGIIRAVKIGAFTGTAEIEKNLKLIMQ